MNSIIISSLLCIMGLIVGNIMLCQINRITEKKVKQKNIKERKEFLNKTYQRIIFCIINSVAWGLAGWQSGSIFTALVIAILFSLAVMIAFIDLSIYIIPNELVVSILVFGILFQLSYFGVKSLVIAAVCMVAVMLIFMLTAAIVGLGKVGAGDIKLAGAMGLVLGYPHIITAVLAMCVAMLIYIMIGIKTYRLSLKSMFAYGPFMMLGMIAALVSIVGNISFF